MATAIATMTVTTLDKLSVAKPKTAAMKAKNKKVKLRNPTRAWNIHFLMTVHITRQAAWAPALTLI